MLAFQAKRAIEASPASLELKARRVRPVQLVYLDNPGSPSRGRRVCQDYPENKDDLAGREQWATRGMPARRACPALKAPRGIWDSPDCRAPREIQDCPECREWRDSQALRAWKDVRGRPGSRAGKVSAGSLVNKGLRVKRDTRDSLVIVDYQDFPELKAILVSVDFRDQMDPLVCQGSKVRAVLQENLD